MNNLCDVCQKKPAVICIHGEGSFCAACHNARKLQEFEIEGDALHAESVTIAEPDGQLHTFHIQHLILGSMVSWEAEEENGYKIHQIFPLSVNLQSQVPAFYQRILKTVQTKTLRKETPEFSASNLLLRDGRYCSLREKGTVTIEENDQEEIVFSVDGETFSPDEFAKMLSPVQGFNMQYQIHDISDPILYEDEYLMPVHITGIGLIYELQEIISLIGNNGFIPYDQVALFDRLFFPLMEKLEFLYRFGNRNEAIAAAEEMIQLLEDTESEDDDFPAYEIECLRQLQEGIF